MIQHHHSYITITTNPEKKNLFSFEMKFAGGRSLSVHLKPPQNEKLVVKEKKKYQKLQS